MSSSIDNKDKSLILALIDNPLPGEMYDEDPEPPMNKNRNEELEKHYQDSLKQWMSK